MNNLLGNLGLCKKAGNLATGFDSVKQAVTGRKAFLVVIMQDVSDKTKKETKFWSDKYGITALELPLKMEQTQQMFHKKIGVAAVLDSSFAELIKKNTGSY